MTVGDINSTERGSGARYNDGKLDVGQIPYRILGARLASCLLDDIGLFEERQGNDLDTLACAFEHVGDPLEVILEAIEVFNYGEKKYARGNWMKGMKWSIPMACIVRHELKIISGENNDPESGLPHRGHIACNLIMLMFYLEHYPEGDDRRGLTKMISEPPMMPIELLAGNAPLSAQAPSEHVNFKSQEWGLGDYATVTLSFSQYCGRIGQVIGLFGDQSGTKSLTLKFDNGNQDVFGINEVLHASPGKPVGEDSGHGFTGGGGDVYGSCLTGVTGYLSGGVQAGCGAALDTVQARHPEGTEL